MTRFQRFIYILPFIILFALFGLLWRELFYSRPNELPSTLIGETVPPFRLPNLFLPDSSFTQNELRGRVSLLNVWASWCYACNLEAAMLMKIKNEYHVPIYGIDYKDAEGDARTWLQKHGNPYVVTGKDVNGDVAIDLGVYGTPETFVINSNGKIVYRHVGAVDQKTWDEVLYPLVKRLEGEV
jgi:cytochrome c biogenesis protein CcmG/thiol:disulfide interchange protein DsbE